MKNVVGRISDWSPLKTDWQEDDWEGWQRDDLNGWDKTVQLVGDDLFVTNIKRTEMWDHSFMTANAILDQGEPDRHVDVKLWMRVEMAQNAGYRASISHHRSGETEEAYYRRSGSCNRCRPDQNRSTLQIGSKCKIQSTAQDCRTA